MLFFESNGIVPGGERVTGSNTTANAASRVAQDARSEVRDLRYQVERLALLNQALWELLRARLNLSDAELEAMAQQVDLRDGVADGKMTQQPVRCPTCARVSNSRHAKCLYCGQLFEKPIFG
ncbi:MAG: hypothetical protein IT368_11425 [Candidatus Hydrogenedentes bacterium]|nr:hypothetical protein [Candidatus Hydrogenedentota bacterium]